VITIIHNPRAGGDGSPDSETVLAAFARHGLDVRLQVLTPDADLPAMLDEAFAGDASCIVAAGGDGTVNAVAECLLDRPHMSLGVLPLGTLNHFARDLGIPLEIDQAVQVLVDGHRVVIDAGEINDRLFLNNASIGLYATIVAHREHERRRLGLGKWPALAKAIWAALRNPTSLEVAVNADGRERQWRTPVLFVGNNDYTVQGPGLGQRTRLDQGWLSVYVLRSKGRWGLLWLGLRALTGGASSPDDFDALQATELEVRTPPGGVQVVRDGEVAVFDTPLRFRMRPHALSVHAPRDHDIAEAR